MSVIFALVLYSERSFTRISLCLLSPARHVRHVILSCNACAALSCLFGTWLVLLDLFLDVLESG